MFKCYNRKSFIKGFVCGSFVATIIIGCYELVKFVVSYIDYRCDDLGDCDESFDDKSESDVVAPEHDSR